MKMLYKTALVATSAILFSACTPKQDNSLYYWGNYSDSVYQYYNKPNELAEQEQALLVLIDKAKNSGKNVAPGVYGHLGLVSMKLGKHAEANAAFTQEKALYPESAQFIQYLQSKLK